MATPGRLCDFVGRGLVSLANCRFLVLDEADRMLDMGFEPQIRRVVEGHDLPNKAQRQTMMFSATFAPPIQRVAASYAAHLPTTHSTSPTALLAPSTPSTPSHRYLRAPYAHVSVGRVGSSIGSIAQRLILAEDGHKRAKLDLLRPLLSSGERTIVFVQKKHVASWVRS